SYQQQQNQDYQTYWLTYRLTGYDSKGQPTFSSALPSTYQYQFTTQQTQALQGEGYTAAQISALAAAKTQQAIQFDSRFGSGTYNPNFSYTASAAQTQQLQAGAVWQQPQLQYPIPVSALTSSGSSAGSEATNISGRNVTLTSSGNIGVGT